MSVRIRKIAQTFSVFDGRDLIGSVREHDAGWDAFDARRKLIGKFRTRKEALAAVDESSEVLDG